MKKNTTKSDKEKAIISGHYVFSKPEFIELKKHVKLKLKKKNIDLDRKLKDSIKYNIMRYLKNFRLVGNE